eukprot:2331394-Alexandrium_andersonii.AAC.1
MTQRQRTCSPKTLGSELRNAGVASVPRPRKGQWRTWVELGPQLHPAGLHASASIKDQGCPK